MFGMLSNPAFQEAEFQVGGRDFKVTKMLPIPAYKLFMRSIRPCLAAIKGVDFPEYKDGDDVDDHNKKFMGAIIEVFASIDYEHLDAMWKEFAKQCVFTRNDAGQYVRITIDPEGLTQGMDPAHILIIVARCFARNFGESALEFAKELGMAMPAAEADSNQKSPTPSSTLESKQDTLLSGI